MARPRVVLTPSVLELVEDWAAAGLSLKLISRRLAELEPAVIVSPDSVRRRLRERGVGRVNEPVAARRLLGQVGRCPACGSVADAHQCAGRWRLRPARDGLVACPQCSERLAPEVVAEHLGLIRGMRAMTPADHEAADEAGRPESSESLIARAASS